MSETTVESDSTTLWSFASLSLVQPGWPGKKKAEWVASVAGSSLFRSRDLLTAMDRLGGEGWDLVTFVPEWNDRSASYIFKRRRAGAG